ncbi:MAG: hypothetical protein JRE56_09825 [Deltaproteobacteria bacterium]|jgi:hypothetical protein|nr:hypothetical protein [Deltaproteobacteria bacterium]MBW2511712.1 hypothetical protein [Deltaproteobacteria bacterium]MDH4007741.1 hypothetical protein [Desulfuromonadales bacterium]
MFLIPLTQIESVDLVIHALRAAGGQADCTMCPVRKVCTKQCLAVADGIQQMVATNSLPTMNVLRDDADGDPPDKPDCDGPGPSHLRIVK